MPFLNLDKKFMFFKFYFHFWVYETQLKSQTHENIGS